MIMVLIRVVRRGRNKGIYFRDIDEGGEFREY